MELRFYPTLDVLNIKLSNAKSIESEEIREGFVFDFDAVGRLVRIEVEDASERVNLELIRKDPQAVVDEIYTEGEIFTVAELAEKIGIGVQALQMTLQAMRAAGLKVGIRPDVSGTMYSEKDLSAVEKWREEHLRGIPRKRKAAQV
jgi:uncharacterized protein YuzE